MQYQINSQEVKENIERGSQSVFTFKINANNMEAKLRGDKLIVFYDRKDASKEIYNINAPFM